MEQFTEGIEKIYDDLTNRSQALPHFTDRALNAAVEPTKVPAKIEGEPWVHSDDDFLFFLDWLVKKGWDAPKIVDVVREPHHYTKDYKAFIDQREREHLDPNL